MTVRRQKPVSSLRMRPVECAADCDGRRVRLVYNARAITPKFQRELTPRPGETALENAARILGALLLEWDLEEDGEPVPLTPETLDELPDEILGKFMTAIWEDHNPPPEPEKNSGSF